MKNLILLMLLLPGCYGNTVQLKGRIVENQRTNEGDYKGMGGQTPGPWKPKPKINECEIGPADRCRADGKVCQYNENGERKCLPALSP